MEINLKQKLGVEWLGDDRVMEIADVPQDPELAAEFIAAIPPRGEYNFRPAVMRDYLVYLTKEDPILLFGPTGSGKSTTVTETAARFGQAVFRMTGSENTELSDIFGSYSLVNGDTKFVYGPGSRAAILGGIFLLDEADRVPANILVGLNGITEGLKPFVIPQTGEIITPAKGFKVIYTANSNLSGSDIYLTAKQHDPSIPERFVASKIDYPENAEEKAILLKELESAGFTDDQFAYFMSQEGVKLNINGVVKEGEMVTKDDFLSGLLQVAESIRKQSRDGGNESSSALERTVSVRSMARWLRYCVEFCGAAEKGQSALHYSLRRSLTNTCTPSTALAIHTFVTTVFAVKES